MYENIPQAINAIKSEKSCEYAQSCGINVQMMLKILGFQAIEEEVEFIAFAARKEENDDINGLLGVDNERLFEHQRKSLKKNN